MPDPTDPHPVADDPSGIVQQMPKFTTEALKPCPFCGEAAKNFSQSQFWLGCSNPECGAELVIRRDKDEAYSAWNRRATEADLRAENERLREENALMAASLDEEERKCGLSTNGGMWRFWARQLREYHARRAALSPETDGGQDE